MNSLAVIGRILSNKPSQISFSRRNKQTGKGSKRRKTADDSVARSEEAQAFHELDLGIREKDAVSDDEETLVDDPDGKSSLFDATFAGSTHQDLSPDVSDPHASPQAAEGILSEKARGKQRARSDSASTLAPTDSVARSVPIKVTLTFYNILRQLLAYLGIPLLLGPPRKSLVAAATTHPRRADKPPSYETAVQTNSDEQPIRPSVARASSSRSFLRNPFRRKRPEIVQTNTAPSILEHPAEQSKARRPSLSSDQSSAQNTNRLSVQQTKQIALLTRPKTLVLDLDETLIHSTSRIGGLSTSGPKWSSTNKLGVRVVEVVLDGRSVVYHVYKRPWVDLFLRKVSTWYDVVIFTASMQEYADPVIDWLDGGKGLINGRLFREVGSNRLFVHWCTEV